MKISIYHNLQSGGGKRALYEMARCLSELHDISVYTLSASEHTFCDLRPICQDYFVYPFEPLPLAKRPFGRLNQGIRTLDLYRLDALQRRIAGDIDEREYDLVFVHGCQFSSSPRILKFVGSPSIYYCQEPPRFLYEPPIDRPYNRLSKVQRIGNLVDPFPTLYRTNLKHMDRENVRSANAILVNSYFSRETIYRTYGVFAQVGRLGVDTDLFRPLAMEKENQIVSVGSLTTRKGFDFIIRSLGQVEPGVRPKLVIVSNFAVPAEQSYLQSLAENLCVEVDFLEGVSDGELVEQYNRSFFTVYAPVMEPFGLVPLESMACGTPVLGVNEAGVRETIRHMETGLLIDRDEANFALAICDLIGDQNRLVTYGANAREHVQKYWTWKQAGNELESQLLRFKREYGLEAWHQK